MKVLLLVLLAVGATSTLDVSSATTAFGYLKNIGIPEAERIKLYEEEFLNKNPSRIVGGDKASPGQTPWQSGLLIDIVGLDGRGVCGASLISSQHLVTAAHCWNDGQNQAWRFTAVLGSTLLFSGGIRVETSAVFVHPNWFPLLIRNDIAVIYLPESVTFSDTIAPVSLPNSNEVDQNFISETATASGFGINSDNEGSISRNQSLSLVNLKILKNGLCSLAFPGIVQSSNICTSGIGGVGPCGGDSGGPLVLVKEDRKVLIGVVSFGSAFGCSIGLPGVFVRVTSYLDFLNQHLIN